MTTAHLVHDARRALRNRRIVIFSVLMPTVMFLVISGTSQGSIDGADVTAYIMVSMGVYGAMSAAIGTGGLIAVERGLGWNRTLRLTPMNPWSYVTAKVLLSMLLAVPPLLAVYTLGATVGHVHLSARAWALVGLASWVGALPFAALGLVIGYLAKPDSVQQVSGVLYLGLSLFGGLWVPVEAMPTVMRTISDWTPAYWVAQLARSPIFPGQTVDWRVAVVVAGWTLGLGVIGLRRFRADTARA
jgi:ABC-2 type transport system permease protein